MTKFQRWLYKRIDEDSPTGDFARDAIDDPNFPKNITGKKIREHLDGSPDYIINVGLRALIDYKLNRKQ